MLKIKKIDPNIIQMKQKLYIFISINALHFFWCLPNCGRNINFLGRDSRRRKLSRKKSKNFLIKWKQNHDRYLIQ